MDDVDKHSPSNRWRLLLLCSLANELPSSQPLVEKAIASVHLHQALRKVPDGEYMPALLSMRSQVSKGAPGSFLAKSSEAADWVAAQGHVQKACIHLGKVSCTSH